MVKVNNDVESVKSFLTTENLGFGQLSLPGYDKQIARSKFFLAINQIAPQVFEDFLPLITQYKELLPELITLAEDKKKRGFTWKELSDFAKVNEKCNNFKSEIQNWAEGWNLNYEWILESVFFTLTTDNKLSERKYFSPWGRIEEFIHNYSREIAKVYKDPKYPEMPHYNPAMERRQDFIEKINKYILDVEDVFQECGWKQSVVKKANKAGGVNRDFEWLVEFQILKKDYREISSDAYTKTNSNNELYVKGKEVDFKEDTVRKAITRAANLIGLELK